MSYLILLRQHIKAVETIKKVTHAMRLISMSAHSRLRRQKENLQEYRQEIERLINIARPYAHKNIELSSTRNPKPLIILIASQKGLCGSFNSNLFRYFDLDKNLATASSIITVGREATRFIEQSYFTPLNNFDNFSSVNFISIADDIARIIINSAYQDIVVYYNYARTFFLQKPQKLRLLPLEQKIENPINFSNSSDYIFEQPAQEIYTGLFSLVIKVTLQQLLFDSLVAEQAARFIAMDAATRNADKLMTNMKLQYNKTRQTMITRELTNLASYI